MHFSYVILIFFLRNPFYSESLVTFEYMKVLKFFLVVIYLSVLLPSCQREKPVTFGIIADCQYCNCDARGARFYRNSLGKLSAAIDTFNSLKPEFVAHLGDFIERDFDSYDTLLSIMDNLEVPVKFVLGNHDFEVDNQYKEKVVPKLGLSKNYYSFIVEDIRFIVTDGNDFSSYASLDSTVIIEALAFVQKLKEDKNPNAYNWNGGIGSDQFKWLKSEIATAEKENQKVIVFNHFPLAPKGAHNLLNYQEILDELQSSSAFIGWFNGHNHAGEYEDLEGNHFVTFHGMVETEQTNAFSMVEVTSDSIFIKGYGREPSRALAIRK